MKKILITLSLCFALTNTVNAANMSAWAVGEINSAAERGLLTDDFLEKNLTVDITREEFCGLIMKLYESLTGEKVRSPEILPFDDTESIPVAKAHSIGIVSGKSDGVFDPDGGITREEIAKMLANTLRVAEYDLVVDNNILSVYDDANSISGWAYEDVSLMVGHGIINGVSEKEISPKTGASREQAIAMVNRTYNKFSDDEENIKKPVETVPVFGNQELPVLNEKEMRVFPEGYYYENKEQADVNMVEVTIDVWNVDKNGEKYQTKKTLTVNKHLAEDVKSIFTEIFNHESQFPIKSIGGYFWRNSAMGKISQHSYGTCIDINPDENYYCYTEDGSAITGTHWTPYEDIYSITPDGIVVSTFEKYGWVWGGSWNGSVRDYMHFSYLGK